METSKNLKNGEIFRSRRLLTLMLVALFTLAAQAACFASTITLNWDAVVGADVVGYKVYYKADSSVAPLNGTGAVQGASPVDVANQTSATITGLDPAHPYYFAITSYDSAGLESPYSNLVLIPELVPPTASITYPANNATVSGAVSVAASASDNVGVTLVEFYVNGVLQSSDTATPYLYSWNTAALASGAYTLQVKAYDAAGNVGQSSTVSVTVVNDTTAPTVALSAPANNATVGGTVALTANASDNVGVTRVEFYENGVLLSASNVAPYSFNWNTASVANGSYVLSAKAFDASGNVGQSANTTVTVFNDTTAPSVSLTSPAAGAALSGTVAVTASASDNIGVSKVEFYANGSLLGSVSSSPYSFSWNTAALSSGSYTLSAKAYDAAGNVGQSANLSVTVSNDTTAPVVSISSPLNNSTATGTVSVSAKASDNVGVSKVEFYVNGVLQGSDSTSPYRISWNTAALSNGTYTLSAKAYDAAGNIGQSANVSVKVSNVTATPVVSIISPLNNSTVAGAVSVSANASDSLGIAKVEFYVNGVLQGSDSAAPYSFSWNTAALSNGVYTLSAKAYDTAGNIGQSTSVSVTVSNDITAPVVSIASPLNASTVTGTVSVSANASDNVGVTKVEFYLDGALQATVTSAPYSFNWNTASVANGSCSLSARAYDAAGNVGTSATVPVTVFNDGTAPLVSIAALQNSSAVSGTATVSVAASDNVGVTRVEFYVNGLLQSTLTSAPYDFSWNTVSLANGSYTLSAKAYDAAGNVGQAINETVTVFNDTTAPLVTINPVNTPVTDPSQTISGSVSDNNAVATVTVQVGTGAATVATISGNSWNFQLTGLAVGSNLITVQATDMAGNSSTAVTSIVVQDTSSSAPAPSFTVGDAQRALQIATGTISPSSAEMTRLDVAPLINGQSVPNGKVDVADALLILKRCVGLVTW